MRLPRASPLVPISIVAVFGVLISAWLVIYYVQARQKIVAFDQFMAPSKIIGKTPIQIVTMYGKPDYDTLDFPDPYLPKNSRVIVYQGPYDAVCRIEFISGKAAQATLGSK